MRVYCGGLAALGSPRGRTYVLSLRSEQELGWNAREYLLELGIAGAKTARQE